MTKPTISSTVPMEVYDRVRKYLAKHLPNYKLIDVIRASNHPEDRYLYMVIAQAIWLPDWKIATGIGTWAFWTCWNDTDQSLYYGHYDYKTYDEALRECLTYKIS